MQVREPTPRDLPSLLSLEQACFEGYYQPHRFIEPQFRAYLRSERTICFVASTSNGVIGYIVGRVRVGRTAVSARIDSLAVSPVARQSGVGSRLVRRFLAESRRRGCRAVTLEVATANEPAFRFFTSRGFRGMQRIPHYYDPFHDAVRMRCTL